MIPGLLLTEGPKKGVYIHLPEKKPFWIGRSQKADFSLKEDKVISNKHCYFIRTDSILCMKDESRNGTRVNSRKISHTWVILKLADIICIGSTHFQVVDVDPQASTISIDFEECLADFKRNENFAKELKSLKTLGDYKNIEMVGSGSFGVVYKSLHKDWDRLVALKVFSGIGEANGKFMGRFLREASLLKRLEHPYLIQLYDTGEVELDECQYHFIAMEYFPGVNLTYHIKSYGKMNWEKVIHLLLLVLSALDYMHKQQVIHRDLKPHNILYNDIKQIPKIIDLGFGKCLTDDERTTFYITRTGSGLGTPYYMPLEQWKGAKNVDERADIYSLGATAYYLLAGVHPYHICGDYLEVLDALNSNNLTPLEEMCFSDTPKSFIEIIKKMMALEASERYASCQEIIAELQALNPKV